MVERKGKQKSKHHYSFSDIKDYTSGSTAKSTQLKKYELVYQEYIQKLSKNKGDDAHIFNI